MRRWVLVLLGLVAGALALALPPLRELLLGAAGGVLGSAVVSRLARRAHGPPVVPAIGAVLRQLEALGWAVCHDDHLVVGPTGAYLLEERRLTGRVSLADGSLVVRRGDGEAWRMSAAAAGRMRAGAKDARSLLGAANLHWVRPVVVLWCDFPAQVAEHAGVAYVHGDRLVRWLQEQPATVSPQSLESARSCLRRFEADAARAA